MYYLVSPWSLENFVGESFYNQLRKTKMYFEDKGCSSGWQY
jgi:hypothetical protein